MMVIRNLVFILFFNIYFSSIKLCCCVNDCRFSYFIYPKKQKSDITPHPYKELPRFLLDTEPSYLHISVRVYEYQSPGYTWGGYRKPYPSGIKDNAYIERIIGRTTLTADNDKVLSGYNSEDETREVGKGV